MKYLISSLDGQGTDDFFKIIKTLEKENIFIISHKGDILFDKFTNIIKYEKYKTFYTIRNNMKELKLIPIPSLQTLEYKLQ